MKTKVLMCLAAMSILLALAMPLSARAEEARVYFTGIEASCDPLLPSRIWASGPNYHVRVQSQTCYEQGSIAQATGTNYASDGVINEVGHESILTVTGKFRLETNEGGIWVGSFTWPANTNLLRAVGQGQGMYEGLSIHMFLDQATGTFWGYIEPGG